jgi:hypothetical protein
LALSALVGTVRSLLFKRADVDVRANQAFKALPRSSVIGETLRNGGVTR